MLNAMALGGEAFERCLGHEGWTLKNGISVLMKQTPQSSVAPLAMWQHGEKLAVCKPEESLHQSTAFITVRDKFLLFISFPISSILL